MSLLRRIQDATTDPRFQLADVLRMCKILAVRLDHPAFKEWISQELNGYKNLEQLPDYRILKKLGSRGDFFGSFNSKLINAPIPPTSLPKEFREEFSIKYMCQSISALESIVSQATQANTSVLQNYWIADAVAFLGSNIYENMVCGQAWTDIPTSALVGILDIVRSRILDFVLVIETKAPDVGEAEVGEQPISHSFVNFIFDRCILHQNNQTALSGAVIQTHNQRTNMSENYENNFQGANVANMANTVRDNARQQANQHIYLSEQKKTLAEACAESQQLLKQLEQDKPNATEIEKVAYVNDETTPSFKRRVVSALQASGEAAIDEFILENKYLKVVKAAFKGWLQLGN